MISKKNKVKMGFVDHFYSRVTLTMVHMTRRHGNNYSKPRFGKCGNSGASWCGVQSAFDNRGHSHTASVWVAEAAL